MRGRGPCEKCGISFYGCSDDVVTMSSAPLVRAPSPRYYCTTVSLVRDWHYDPYTTSLTRACVRLYAPHSAAPYTHYTHYTHITSPASLLSCCRRPSFLIPPPIGLAAKKEWRVCPELEECVLRLLLLRHLLRLRRLRLRRELLFRHVVPSCRALHRAVWSRAAVASPGQVVFVLLFAAEASGAGREEATVKT